MKKIILHVLLYLITSTIIGQNSLEVQYDVITNISHLYKTTGILKVNNNKSHYIVLKPSNTPKEITEKRIDGKLHILVPESDRRPQVFININTNLLISYESMFRRNNILKEQLPKINWKIINQYKKIGNYKCQKAIGYFRGRTYTTWFTNEISVPFGPWKLQGLPGLIIEAKDNKKEVYFRASKISFKDNIAINNFPSEQKAIPLREFIEIIIPKEFKALELRLNSKHKNRNTTTTLSLPDRNSEKEIIYEWEEK